MEPQFNQRLTRIEEKIDKLAEVTVNLARMEEMIISQIKRADRFEKRLDMLEASDASIKEKIHFNEAGLKNTERVI